jgi:hypothetical protein
MIGRGAALVTFVTYEPGRHVRHARGLRRTTEFSNYQRRPLKLFAMDRRRRD